jgi:serine/threonine-protein kinase
VVAAARLDHENIVRIHDVDEEGGRLFIVMEYVEGEDLDAHLKRKGALPMRRAVEIAREVTRALEHAHAAGVVHRDVKPANILLGKNGRVKITDFGLAQDVGHRESGDFVLGTPWYISPEQVQGKAVDGRSDVYSLGVTLYQMLTGRRPFEGKSPDSVVRKHIEKPRPLLRLRRPALPSALETTVHRMMAVDPKDRFATASDLRRALESLLVRRPVRLRSAP